MSDNIGTYGRDNMFEYNYNPKLCILNICLPKMLKYDFKFMDDMTELIAYIMDNKRGYKEIRISCKSEPVYDKMCKAYIFNVLRYLSKKRKVLWSYELNRVITSSVNTTSGSKFTAIDLQKAVYTEELNDYRFGKDENVKKPVEEIAKIIVEKNISIGRETLKEFLTTTIGEIFSNAFLHSDKDELFFIYDIEKVDKDYFLCVTVIDYGNTIVQNVKTYFEEEAEEDISSENCISWAIVNGNTTRKGSGGYGLPTLINYIERAKGELIILSGDVYYRLKEQKTQISKLKGFFAGTSVTFRIKLFETGNIIWYDKDNEKLISISLESL